MERAIINTETGEVIGTIGTGDRIVRAESINRLKSKTSDYTNHFIKANEEEGRLVLGELDSKEKVVLFTLQYYVSYESGLLRYSNGKDIGFSEMVDIIGMSRGTLSKVIDGLIAKDILYKGRNSHRVQYFMNPWLFSKGEYNPTLKDMFGNYIIRSKGNVRWKDL